MILNLLTGVPVNTCSVNKCNGCFFGLRLSFVSVCFVLF